MVKAAIIFKYRANSFNNFNSNLIMQVFKYNPVLYPVKLHILKLTDVSEITNVYYKLNKKPLIIAEMDSLVEMCVIEPVREIESKLVCILVLILDESKIPVSSIAHEATHVARLLWSHLGESDVSMEADAYLVGWVAQCISDSLNNEITL